MCKREMLTMAHRCIDVVMEQDHNSERAHLLTSHGILNALLYGYVKQAD